MINDYVHKNGKQGLYAGDCTECGLMLMKDDPSHTYVREDFPRHTDVKCPRCNKKVEVENG